MTKKHAPIEKMPQARSDADGISAEQPLAWWRTKRAETFGASSAATLREAIAGVAILDSPTWTAAANGDAAAAISLALRLHSNRASRTAYDLVTTALAACAAEDDAAACLAMARTLRRCPGAGQTEARLATSWLVRSFLKTLRDRKDLGGRL